MDGTEYITLKEASEISGYSPDYIGQLIRGGKLEGKQVYANVAWVTTRDALRGYLDGKGKTKKQLQQAAPIHEVAASDIEITDEEKYLEQHTSQAGALVLDRAAQEGVHRWERLFRVFSVVIIVFSILFLALLLRIFLMLLDERALQNTTHTASLEVVDISYA